MATEYQLLDSLFLPFFVIGEDFSLEFLNNSALKQIQKESIEQCQDKKCYELIYRRETPCPFCPLCTETERQLLENSHHPIEKIIYDTDFSERQKNVSKSNNNQIEINSGATSSIEDMEKSYRVIFSQLPDKKLLIETKEDITLQKENEDKNLRNENLTALGVMISGISHEMNNSLTGMGLNLQNLIANHSSIKKEELSLSLDILRKDLYQVSRIVSDILLFSNPSKANFTKAKLLQTINKAISTTIRQYPVLSRPIQWDVSGEDIIFPFNPQKIERMFINLFRNSLQAFDYKPGKIEVKLKRTLNSVRITVKDNAGGIDNKLLKKIFNPFYTNTPGNVGSGLGLSISHSITREHNGYIHVRSKNDTAIFYISLPLRQDSQDERVYS